MSDPTRTTQRVPQTEEQIRAVRIGEPARLTGKIRLVDYDPAWPQQFASEAGRIRAGLGAGVPRIEHAGPTSVPGLAARPLIDIVLVLVDSSDEPSHLPPPETARAVPPHREP